VKAYDKLFTSAPFLHNYGHSRVMLRDLFLALIFLFLFSIFLFGYASIIIVATAYIAGFLIVWIYRLFDKRMYFNSFAWQNSILIYALSLPPTIPWYINIFGVFCMMILGQSALTINKKNIFNPALIGRICIMVLFPRQLYFNWEMTLPKLFPIVLQNNINSGNHFSIIQSLIEACNIIAGFNKNSDFDMLSTSTPLGIYKLLIFQYQRLGINIKLPELDWFDIFIGNRSGSLGETSILILIVIYLWLSIRKIINPIIPVLYILVFVVWTLCFGGLKIGQGFFYFDLLPYIFSGSLFFSAILLLTEYSTMPNNNRTYYIMTICTSIISASLFLWSNYSDAHIITFLLMNASVSLFEIIFKPPPFGMKKRKFQLNFNFDILRNFGKYYTLRISIGIFIMILSYIGSTLVSTSNFEVWKNNQFNELIKEVFPEYIIQKKIKKNLYQALSRDREELYIIESKSKGYKMDISLLVVIKDDTIFDIKVLTGLEETYKISDKFLIKNWEKSFIGIKLGQIPNTVYGLGFYDMVSGATITTSGILDAIKKSKIELINYNINN